MKFILNIGIILLFSIIQIFATETEISQDKLREAAMILVNDCKEKEGASDDDVSALKHQKLPTSEKGICMVQCLFNTAKIMKDGKFYKEGAIEFSTPAMKNDQDKIKKMEKMMNICEKELSDKSGCGVAKLIIECTAKHGKEFGFEFPNHIKE